VTDTLALAMGYLDFHDFSVIPLDHPHEPLAKDPDDVGKIPAIKTWKVFQTVRPIVEQVTEWFGNGVVSHNSARLPSKTDFS